MIERERICNVILNANLSVLNKAISKCRIANKSDTRYINNLSTMIKGLKKTYKHPKNEDELADKIELISIEIKRSIEIFCNRNGTIEAKLKRLLIDIIKRVEDALKEREEKKETTKIVQKKHVPQERETVERVVVDSWEDLLD